MNSQLGFVSLVFGTSNRRRRSLPWSCKAQEQMGTKNAQGPR